MPSTPMTQEEMEEQCEIVSAAVKGDPGEENEKILLEVHHRQRALIAEVNDLAYQVRCMSQGIKAMMEVTERNMKTIEDRMREFNAYVTR